MPVRYVRVHERVEVVMVQGNWKLVTESGEAAVVGGEYADFRGEINILSGGKPPHKPSSTGKVYIKAGETSQEFYPSVIGLRWIEQVA